jgi:hypothetical protein
MTSLAIQNAIQNLTISNVLQLRFGKREISIHKDGRKRLYRTHPIVECRAGPNAGHLEILLLRNWLIVFSKAWR